MFNRLRRWLYRRIEGAPQSPLSVQVSDPWTLSGVEELRGRIARRPFDHDAVQLRADYDADYDYHLGSDY